MGENKQLIAAKLVTVLQITRNQSDLKSEKRGDLEIVTAKYDNGFKKEINVTMDSGTAMIRDMPLIRRCTDG